MNDRKLLGERVGYHADPAWDRPDPCWGECSYCLQGAYRYEDEATAEKALAVLKRWASNCADRSDMDS